MISELPVLPVELCLWSTGTCRRFLIIFGEPREWNPPPVSWSRTTRWLPSKGNLALCSYSQHGVVDEDALKISQLSCKPIPQNILLLCNHLMNKFVWVWNGIRSRIPSSCWYLALNRQAIVSSVPMLQVHSRSFMASIALYCITTCRFHLEIGAGHWNTWTDGAVGAHISWTFICTEVTCDWLEDIAQQDTENSTSPCLHFKSKREHFLFGRFFSSTFLTMQMKRTFYVNS